LPTAWPTTIVHALLHVAAAFVLLVPGAVAQTTVTLTSGTGLSDNVTIRGGGYASVNHGASDELTTKQDADPSYDRRVLLKFDTQSTIPAGASITSARLYLTLKSPGGASNRTLTVYRVTQSFLEREATWYNYRLGAAWASPGGDLAETFGARSVGSAVGTAVDFDVTDLVRRTVSGDFGSRYTRLALVDDGSAADDSYRGFWSSRATDGSRHPRLVITYGTGASDTTAPTVAVTAPGPGATVSGTVALAASASDNVGVASVQFRVNGANVGAADSSSPYTASWNTTGLAAGTYTVTAVATDAAGNTATSAGVSVTIAGSGVVTNARSVTFTSASHNETLPGGQPVVSSYLLEIWTAGSDTTGTPYRTTDMGKPSTSSTTVTIDQAAFFAGLPRNQQFIATVSAIGPNGSARSEPSNVFVMP
jgi:hypothetical protein